MKKLIFGLGVIGLIACGKKSEVTKDLVAIKNLRDTREIFESQIKDYIKNENLENDSVSTETELDTLYVLFPGKTDYSLTFGQFHTADKKLHFGIIGIGDFSDSMPTLLLADGRQKKYITDSVKVSGDSLFIFGKTQLPTGDEKFKIGFDLKFDGKNFPWNVD